MSYPAKAESTSAVLDARETARVIGAVVPPYLNLYDVDASGQRFLVREPIEQVATQPLTVLVNWSHEVVAPR